MILSKETFAKLYSKLVKYKITSVFVQRIHTDHVIVKKQMGVRFTERKLVEKHLNWLYKPYIFVGKIIKTKNVLGEVFYLCKHKNVYFCVTIAKWVD